MPSLLHQLENNEAVLLLYLAGELPPEDLAEVEQQLASDAGLRRALESLRGLEHGLTLALSEADRVSMPPPATQSAMQLNAVRRVSRAMVKLQLERSEADSSQALPVSVRSLRLPAWSYPFATAAMILIGWVAYWGFSSGGPSHPIGTEIVVRPETTDRSDDDVPYPPMAPDESGHHRLMVSLPSMGMDEGDVNLVAISVGSYQVSSMFQPVKE